MEITCKQNSFRGLPEVRQKAIGRFLRADDGYANLVKGLVYVAVGAVIRDNFPWFYVFEEPEGEYPKPYPVDYFEIDVWRVPEDWIVRSHILSNGNSSTEIVPYAWASFPRFYERLVDGDEMATHVIKKIKSMS